MNLRITGCVRETETGQGVGRVVVEAFDADAIHDDLLGTAATDPEGRFAITCQVSQGILADRPDVYLIVKDERGRVLQSTRSSMLRDVEQDVEISVNISCWKLLQAGLRDVSQLPAAVAKPAPHPEYRRLLLQPSPTPNDALLGEIERELASQTTILELLRHYMQQLKHEPDSNAPAFRKMAKLFELGTTYDAMHGHFYGVALGLRLESQQSALSRFNNVIGLLWGATLQDESPWVGKTFRLIDAPVLRSLTHDLDGQPTAFLGINHFNRLDCHPLNSVAFHALTGWLNLADAPPAEQQTFGYEHNGGHFVAHVAKSVCAETPRDVFALNYRWKSLGNRPPLAWLIDEMVKIADGLYLGQLLMASRRLLSAYDPRRSPDDFHYRHMGYFALWDERWNPEARRLFPFLEMPITAPGLLDATPPAPSSSAAGTTALTCEAPAIAACDDRVFAQVKEDLRSQETVLHLLKTYSDSLQDNLDNSSPYFARLQELFNRGLPVSEMRGFYRGALVSWRGHGLSALFGRNQLNLVWRTFAARFSTWTGKSFEPISRERLAELTDGFEQSDVPTFWGANTQALRTMKERELGWLMKLANVWSEPVSGEEALQNGYDLKNFFFIAHAAESLNAQCRGKRVFQFNYRWPKLRTLVPDCYCIDEMVQIAEGLYLGQLMYATDLLKRYDPRRPAAEYHYEMFGYFLLMTEDWHRLRLRLGFDLENT